MQDIADTSERQQRSSVDNGAWEGSEPTFITAIVRPDKLDQFLLILLFPSTKQKLKLVDFDQSIPFVISSLVLLSLAL